MQSSIIGDCSAEMSVYKDLQHSFISMQLKSLAARSQEILIVPDPSTDTSVSSSEGRQVFFRYFISEEVRPDGARLDKSQLWISPCPALTVCFRIL